MFYIITLVCVCVLPICVFLYENTASLLYPRVQYSRSLHTSFSQKYSKSVTLFILFIGLIGVTSLLGAIYYFLEKDGTAPGEGPYSISVIYAIPSLLTLCSWVVFVFLAPYGMVHISLHLFL